MIYQTIVGLAAPWAIQGSDPVCLVVDGASVDQADATVHAFIVRVWIEETAEEAGQTIWRGHITHVPSGERHYVSSLGDISTFLEKYLLRMGVAIHHEPKNTDG